MGVRGACVLAAEGGYRFCLFYFIEKLGIFGAVFVRKGAGAIVCIPRRNTGRIVFISSIFSEERERVQGYEYRGRGRGCPNFTLVGCKNGVIIGLTERARDNGPERRPSCRGQKRHVRNIKRDRRVAEDTDGVYCCAHAGGIVFCVAVVRGHMEDVTDMRIAGWVIWICIGLPILLAIITTRDW